ncbi:MAG: hypothetical protein RL660_2879 [Bacteroidota bacterium]|jgi:hypothetical protein
MTALAEIQAYNAKQTLEDASICDALLQIIGQNLPQAAGKLWHGHPVWFIADNPIVGYSKRKHGISLLFWSGQSFEEASLIAVGKFKAAELRFITVKELDEQLIERLLHKACTIQWDYANIVKRKGRLEKLGDW